jgi:serine protease inhibitor
MPSSDASFFRADGITVSVRTMHEFINVGYAQGPGWQAVELPLRGDLAMRILLPARGGDPNALLAASALTATFEPRWVEVALPRWDFSATTDLKAALGALGVHQAFDRNTADFSGISVIHPLYIDQAVHRATITVNEAGTEATGATGIAMLPLAGHSATTTFTADHPFAFAIVHTKTGVPLFMGHVADPSAHTA